MTHPWARAGSHRFPGDPSHAFALFQDPGRAGKISPWRSCRCCPRSTQTEGLSGHIISRLTQGFSIRCLRFTSDVAATHARPASGWRAAPLPGGGRTLWITSKGFRLHLHSPFQDFSCRKGRPRQQFSSYCSLGNSLRVSSVFSSPHLNRTSLFAVHQRIEKTRLNSRTPSQT